MNNSITIFSGLTASGKTYKMMEFVKSSLTDDVYPIVVTPHKKFLAKYSSHFPLFGEEGIKIFCDLLLSRIAREPQKIKKHVLCAIDEFEYFSNTQPSLITELWQVANSINKLDASLCLTSQDTTLKSLHALAMLAQSPLVSICKC